MFRWSLMLLVALAQPQSASSQIGARVYVYAQRETPARSHRLIRCDGKPVAKIKRGEFFAIDVAAGRHVLSTENGVPALVTISDGDESFIRLSWPQKIGESPTLVLENAPAVVARKEMRFVVYIGAKKVLSASVPKTDPRVTKEPHFKHRELN